MLRQDEKPWVPEWLEGGKEPVDAGMEPEDKNVHLNTVPGEIEVATEEELREEIRRFGTLREPEIGREEKPPPPGAAAFGSYIDDYPTRFFFQPYVSRLIARVQKRVPWQTYACSYEKHPPVYGHTYERVSTDFWGGGLVNGRYAGYRGKPIGTDLGRSVFNLLWNDPYRPNILWIIFEGKMWSRGYGWGPAPWGPAGSDAGHHYHCHVTHEIL
jgi:hypothetical protein